MLQKLLGTFNKGKIKKVLSSQTTERSVEHFLNDESFN